MLLVQILWITLTRCFKVCNELAFTAPSKHVNYQLLNGFDTAFTLSPLLAFYWKFRNLTPAAVIKVY